MNAFLLAPTDILFFRDGRPMSGSLSGHGAAWPLPTVTNAAFHAALWRAKFADVHPHDQIRLQDHKRERIRKDDRKFGSLLTAGPFPVSPQGAWFFPRPLDAGVNSFPVATFLPLARDLISGNSSLPTLLKYPVTNTKDASKDLIAPWWNTAAWRTYLGTVATDSPPTLGFKSDSDFCDAESSFGIGLDDATDAQDGERFYSAHYLRLREGWKLGLLASAHDKINGNQENTRDLLESLFPNSGTKTPVIVGGQQRLCSVQRRAIEACSDFPLGKSCGFKDQATGKHLVKWVLLTPAIFPAINTHTGGWLPSWINMSGEVQLLDGPGKNFAARHKGKAGSRIPATLVAAVVGKPIPVTGYALDNGLEDRKPGPKHTHLAVPAGSVYYFECAEGPPSDPELHARALAAALNWHGSAQSEISNFKSQIQNRRSTLMGEKGFGLGVCGTWNFSCQDISGPPRA
ncbi:MAG: hypothetical protein NTW21_36795 [Verrucomicrobia bacterium]|nr:hypothetical protein [Verrucomicrobiota bacterium]